MALLTFPHFLSHSPSISSLPNRRLFSPTPCHFSLSGVKMMASGNTEKSGTAILWFKHDLRIDDHPGLTAASEYQALVPVYVFDNRILSCSSDEMLELIPFAVDDLRKSLKDRGSNLMIRFGNAESVIQELAREVVKFLLANYDVL